ncbi:hypothetical protein [Gordonia sp. (in: high G+C Gram-positive bacteria)]|uniref:hypothetical protein n=1 Tax=Gordonia sp. (in: high G+C Gram-positive bacteria) TaxID=84139 RepID=UPI0039E66FE4
MRSTKLVSTVVAVGSAAAVALTAAPADAAPRIVLTGGRGTISGHAYGLPPGLKTCTLWRELKPQVDGPMSTFSNDSYFTKAATGRTSGPAIRLSSRPLPRGSYAVSMDCTGRNGATVVQRFGRVNL